MAKLARSERFDQLRPICVAVVLLVSGRLLYGLVLDRLWIELAVIGVKCCLVGGLLCFSVLNRAEGNVATPQSSSPGLILPLLLLTVLSITSDLAVALLVR